MFLQNDEENMIASLNSQFESLSAENQKRVMALHDPDTSGDIDQKVMRIFKINCIEGWSSQKWSKNLQKERKTIFLCSKPCGRRCTLPNHPKNESFLLTECCLVMEEGKYQEEGDQGS